MWRCRGFEPLPLERFGMAVWGSASSTWAFKGTRDVEGRACFAWRSIFVTLDNTALALANIVPYRLGRHSLDDDGEPHARGWTHLYFPD